MIMICSLLILDPKALVPGLFLPIHDPQNSVVAIIIIDPDPDDWPFLILILMVAGSVLILDPKALVHDVDLLSNKLLKLGVELLQMRIESGHRRPVLRSSCPARNHHLQMILDWVVGALQIICSA